MGLESRRAQAPAAASTSIDEARASRTESDRRRRALLARLLRAMMRLIALALMLGLLAACTPGPPSSSRADARAADPERGRLLAWQAGCGACHVIPGVRGADGA